MSINKEEYPKCFAFITAEIKRRGIEKANGEFVVKDNPDFKRVGKCRSFFDMIIFPSAYRIELFQKHSSFTMIVLLLLLVSISGSKAYFEARNAGIIENEPILSGVVQNYSKEKNSIRRFAMNFDNCYAGMMINNTFYSKVSISCDEVASPKIIVTIKVARMDDSFVSFKEMKGHLTLDIIFCVLEVFFLFYDSVLIANKNKVKTFYVPQVPLNSFLKMMPPAIHWFPTPSLPCLIPSFNFSTSFSLSLILNFLPGEARLQLARESSCFIS